MAGSAALLRERLRQDFGVGPDDKPNQAYQDADEIISQVSGLEDEIDEWAALNKYAILRSYQDTQEKKTAARERQIRMREELEKQQREFRDRQELFKIDQQRFAKEQQTRNKI